MEIIVRKATEGEKVYMMREPIWESGVAEFNWHYPSAETCYIIEGQATVEYAGGKASFGTGDLVTFPKGMDCVWKVTIPMRKHFR
ncbi:cupin domain-containing protein [Clostridium minihomine]|uniref:cupin domain-containing protein n=1 Tax=Clostridium minihomine TaxID=2045012 RepID=UPI000C778F07|nr:cupin domain-containing protein [Clostridium minihomine]